jgi:group I intron endonuclease
LNCSIYFIKCLANNKKYIGSCLNYNSRIRSHFGDLMKGKHSNKLLQADFNYYGKSNFEYGLLEECKEEEAMEKENYYMDINKSYILEYGTDFGYNISRASRKQCLSDFTKLDIKDTSNYSKAFKGNKRARKLSEIQCIEIKKLLLEETDELVKEKLKRISEIYGVSSATIGAIRNGTSSYTEELNGGIEEWIKEKE